MLIEIERDAPMPPPQHYLRAELYQEVQSRPLLFEFLQSGSLDGIWYWDLKNQENEWMSPRFWEVLGYEARSKKHLASEWQGLVHPEDLEKALKAFQAHADDPNCPYDVEVRYRHAKGHWVWIRCRGMILRDDDGQPHRMLGAHTDITSLKDREEKLQRAIEDLETTNAALNEFAAVASHDLRSPMTAVAQLAEILLADIGDDLNERHRRMLTLIQTRSETLAVLLKSMLEYVRVNHQTEKEAPSPVDLRSAVDEAIKLYGRETDEVAITGDAVAFAIPSHIHTVFRNLVSNAMKHHDGDRVRIHVTLREVTGKAIILFDDDGPGIAQEHRENVFQLFRTLHPKDAKNGVGLGLAMTRRLLTASGGDISIGDKEDGRGTRFVIRVPVYRDAR